MIVFRWIAFSLLLFIGGWAIIANWVIPFQRGGGSLIPVLGGTMVAVALVAIPVDAFHWFWWIRD